MYNFPLKGGLCDTCDDKENCPMNDMLKSHNQYVKLYGEYYKDIRPDLWDEYAIDEPEVGNDVVIWCPMHYRESEN